MICDTLQSMMIELTSTVSRMSDREKFDFRCGIRKAFRMRMTTTPKTRDTVTVELFSGHKIQGVVKAVYDSVSGKKFQVCSGDITVKVEEGQIILE